MQRPRLLITRRLPEAVHERLRNSYDVTANADDLPLDREALARALREFDALVPTITDRFDAELLQRRAVQNPRHRELWRGHRAHRPRSSPARQHRGDQYAGRVDRGHRRNRAAADVDGRAPRGRGRAASASRSMARLGSHPTTRAGPARENAGADRIRPHRPRNRAPRARLARRARCLSFALARVG